MKTKNNTNIYNGYIKENLIDAHKNNKAEMRTDSSINTDPFGSYTGVPTDGGEFEEPVQDVDDL